MSAPPPDQGFERRGTSPGKEGPLPPYRRVSPHAAQAPSDERVERRGTSPGRQGPLPPYRRASPRAVPPPPKFNVDEPTVDEEETEDGDDETEDTEGAEETDYEAQMDDTTKREAMQYWGQLFDSEMRCTDLLDRLLTSLAKYIVRPYL
jgi:hypothetical protein